MYILSIWICMQIFGGGRCHDSGWFWRNQKRLLRSCGQKWAAHHSQYDCKRGVCECVSVRERERTRESAFVCLCMCVNVREKVCVCVSVCACAIGCCRVCSGWGRGAGACVCVCVPACFCAYVRVCEGEFVCARIYVCLRMCLGCRIECKLYTWRYAMAVQQFLYVFAPTQTCSEVISYIYLF